MEPPRLPFRPTVSAELAKQFRLALPATLSYLLSRSLVSIGLVFIGRLGDLPLAAAALANTTSNVSGLSIVVGMSTAASTICGQAFGAGNFSKVGRTLRLSLLVFWAACLPISLAWWHSEAILRLCGQSPAIAAGSGSYLRWLIPFIWAFAAQGAINTYLNSQRMMKPGAIASGLTAPFHLILCLVFFKVLETDYLGGAQAMAISGVANTAFLIMIVRVRGLHGKTWGAQMPSGTGQQASRGNWQLSVPSPFEHSWEEVKLFLQLAGAGVISLSEWWASEIGILMSGLLPHPEYTVASMSIFQITLGQCFYFSLGIGIAASTRVSNHLGAGDPVAARLAARAAIIFGVVMVSTLFVAVQLGRFDLPFLYTDDATLADMLSKNFFVMAFYVVGDGLCVIFGSILRGCGLQVMAAKVVVFSYYVVGLPVAYLLGFHTQLGVIGICMGVTLGTYVHSALYGYLVLRIDWDEQARLAVARSKGGAQAAAAADDDTRPDGSGGDRASDDSVVQQEKKALLQDNE